MRGRTSFWKRQKRLNEFEAIGAQFRQAREERELTLQQVEKKTRIRIKYLQAIEYGDFYAVDMPLQLRGFLRNYAIAVGLDPDLMQAHFNEAVEGQQKGRRRKKSSEAPQVNSNEVSSNTFTPASPIYPTEKSYASSSQVLPSKRSNVVKGIVTLLVVFGLTGAVVAGIVIAVNDLTADEENPSDNQILTVNTENETPNPTSTIAPTIPPTANNTPVISPGEGLHMAITADQRLWVRVVVDGQTDVPAFEGILRPQEGFNFNATNNITVRTSNAAGLQIIINNQPYSLGDSRVEVERTFSVEGISTPTPLPGASPTMSYTPTLTDTPVASITATRTNTPTQALENETSPTSATLLFTDIPGISSPTLIPTFDSSTNTYTPPPTVVQPSALPTFTPSPFLPPRETRTPIANK